MKREIKFRVKAINGDKWYYGSLIDYGNPAFCDIVRFNDDNEAIHEYVDINTVGQYTGFYDKNGKEIYEGDIIRTYGSKGDEINHIVYYSDKEAMFCTKLIGADMLGGSITQRWLDEFEFEVINNIYDNPELLKGGSNEKDNV